MMVGLVCALGRVCLPFVLVLVLVLAPCRVAAFVVAPDWNVQVSCAAVLLSV